MNWIQLVDDVPAYVRLVGEEVAWTSPLPERGNVEFQCLVCGPRYGRAADLRRDFEAGESESRA